MKSLFFAPNLSYFSLVRELSIGRCQDRPTTKVSTIKLPINFDKCCVLDFVTKRNFCLSPISVHHPSLSLLQGVSSIRFLGVVISSDFKWNLHFEALIKKSSKRLFVLRNLRRSGCPVDLLFKAYAGFIRPIITYSFSSFCNAPSYLMKRLLSVEKRAFRIMGLDPASYPSVLDVANKCSSNLFLHIEKNKTHPLRSIFDERVSSGTRSSLSLKQPFSRTKRLKNSFIKYCE